MSKSVQELIDGVVDGSISLRQLAAIATDDLVATTRLALEATVGRSLDVIGDVPIDPNYLNHSAENVIGAVNIPLGVVGPLPVLGQFASGEYYVPMATTEGALIASVNRGVKSIRLSGGAVTAITRDAMTRAPLFTVDSITQVADFKNWCDERIRSDSEELQSIVKGTTRYGRFESFDFFSIANNIWLRLRYSTGDAMGMNMATKATDQIIQWILSKNPDVRCGAVSGNLCSDKKDSAINNILGRGKSVCAEVLLKKRVLSDILHTSAKEMCDLNARKNLLGSGLSGSTKFNAHYANVIAAIFLATGQDIAEVVESSSGFTWTEERADGDLYFSVTMPSLEVGTVGGGTELATQRAALHLLGVDGEGSPIGKNASALAEVICATTMAGELNLLAALASGAKFEARPFSWAHDHYGRGGRHQERP